MHKKVDQAFEEMLRNWNSMSRAVSDDAEATANDFEASFYIFIDALREWVNGWDPRPQSLEDFLALSVIQEMVDRLPAPLLLNFETEAELIV